MSNTASAVEGQDYYFSDAGLLVMTEASHAARGTCCGNHCLHCPYEYAAVLNYPSVVAPVAIRCATPADVPALALLGRQTFASTYLRYQDDVGGNLVPYLAAAFAPAKVATSILKESCAWWVAVDAKGLLWGYAKLSFESRDAAHPSGHHLQRLYVRRQARGHRIGQRLLHTVEAFAKTRDADHLWLTTLSAERAVTDFYPARGFTKIADVDYQLGSQTFQLSLLEKLLV